MWLLEPNTAARLQEWRSQGSLPTAQQQQDYIALIDDGDNGGSGNSVLRKAGDVAEINVSGVLTKKPDLLAFLLGGGNTTYRGIEAALAEAEQDDEVGRIVLRVDSPGGSVDGMYSAMDAVAGMSKPVEAAVEDMAASAAYALASQADTIRAKHRASMVGSVGVAATVPANEIDGVHTLTSSEAPDKRPDPATDEGRRRIVAELDRIHHAMAEALARGRGTTVEDVNQNYGRGGMLMAEEARARGMIDVVGEPQREPAPLPGAGASATASKSESGGKRMDLETMKAEHPALYREIVQAGVQQERDRVCAHLRMGEASGAISTALEAVRDGKDMTQELQAEYMSAAINTRDQQARAADEGDVSDAADAAGSDKSGSNDTRGSDLENPDMVEQMLTKVEHNMGVKHDA